MMETWKKVIAGIIVSCFLWLAMTNAIFQLSNPSVTQTEAFLHLPRTVMLDFKP